MIPKDLSYIKIDLIWLQLVVVLISNNARNLIYQVMPKDFSYIKKKSWSAIAPIRRYQVIESNVYYLEEKKS